MFKLRRKAQPIAFLAINQFSNMQGVSYVDMLRKNSSWSDIRPITYLVFRRIFGTTIPYPGLARGRLGVQVFSALTNTLSFDRADVLEQF